MGYSNYTVIRKADGEKIGSCGLYDREGLDGIDLGFAFLPEYEGQGYAFEASHRILQAAFQEFGLAQLSAITAKDNYASQQLLKKLKFKVANTITLPNGTQELLSYTFEKHMDWGR
ncbi:MAG: GNAT family N-acetyltransferase [Bacteroidota bacterium]